MSDLLDFSPPGQATFSLAGAKARFYDAGTTTPRTVYADEAETVPHPSPLLADSSGRFAQAFVSGGAVKVVVTQSDDSTGYTLDPCVKVAATGAAASSISFSPTTELPFNNVQDAIEGLAGLNIGRNRIINGQGRINQRGYVSGTNTSGANQYTLDRWRVVTSGQNLTFTGTDAGRTMTAPAGGVEQVIEGANIEGGTYVLNWTGTATATVNGTARTKGETFTLTANTNATVRFSSGTFTDVQLELGSSPTTFERLSIGQELANCQRYYYTNTATSNVHRLYSASGVSNMTLRRMSFPTVMRVAPTSSFTTPTYVNASTLVIDTAVDSWDERVTATATGVYAATGYTVTFDAEI